MGNSPSRIVELDLHGRRVVQRTSSGTQGVVAAEAASEVVLGSFVIAGATVRYVRGRDAISLVAMGTEGGDDHGEDEICAAYLEQLLLDAAPPRPEIALAPAEQWPDWFPRRDAELALEVDRFDFALPVTREDGLLIARPVFV
jgi:2-phosphosulfolactate phosphatase